MENQICTQHNIGLVQGTSKTKFNADGSPKTYWYHRVGKVMCFGDDKRTTPATPSTGNSPSVEAFQQSLGTNSTGGIKSFASDRAESTDWNERSRRIERQHSQTAALEYLQLKGITEFTKEELIRTINWFAEDIDRTVDDLVEKEKEKEKEEEKETNEGEIGSEIGEEENIDESLLPF